MVVKCVVWRLLLVFGASLIDVVCLLFVVRGLLFVVRWRCLS